MILRSPGRRAPLDLPEDPPRSICANCGAPLSGPGAVVRGRPTAWHCLCGECFDLCQADMELVDDCPADGKIQIYRCRRCGDQRSCRPGWRTRCHVCLDDRSSDSWLAECSDECRTFFAHDPLSALRAGRSLAVGAGEPLTPRVIVQAAACLTVATALSRYERQGWTIIATDVWGLPWRGVRTRSDSHGTWGRHDQCGSIVKMRVGSVDCPACGPQPGSRTHRARQADPYLLYLVAASGLTKFGIGTEERVRAHQRAGATVIQVLRATFAEVVFAERALKTRHADQVLGHRTRKMPATFGQGTEVVKGVAIGLPQVLPHALDVTAQFGSRP